MLTCRYCRFQSTHPSWGATSGLSKEEAENKISIHAPIVGCDVNCFPKYDNSLISIHAPIVGCDIIYPWSSVCCMISIHAPIVGCDISVFCGNPVTKRFQSTHPSWGATQYEVVSIRSDVFQSTHPSWGATKKLFRYHQRGRFQSTHPSWGATKTVTDYKTATC